MADQMDQQCEVEIGNEASGAADILQRALQEAATECFESSSEHSNLERATSNSPPTTNNNPQDQIIQDLNIKQAPPVGSSQNPIQIIQQGNTYHSTQSLSQEQLQQIAQVLQQQQLVQATQKGGTSVLYNPVTNTRVVYRVIYPGQQNAKGSKESSSDKTDGGSRGRGRGRVRKGWGRRSPEEDEKAEGSGPELSREEKEERKKHRPRTRSGRISKPPSYMVKDYKRIHHLDFDEEPYDDSDGGYSDFNVSVSSEDEEVHSEDSKSRRLPAGVTTARRRNFKCGTCDKAYIGRGGLARHYRLNPDHGNHDELESDDRSNATIHSADDSNMMDQSLDGAEEQRTNTVSTSRNEEIKLQLSPSLVEAVPESLVSESEKVSIDQQYKREPKCSQRKGDPVHRKARLKGVLHQCNDEEVMEVVMPRLTKVASAWQFLQKKCERGPNVDITKMYAELEDVLKHATKVAQDYLVKPDSQLCSEHLNVTDDHVARALGLTVGTYGIKQSEALEFDLRLPKPRPENEIASESASVSEPAEKRRRIDDGCAETFTLLEDPVCHGSYFIEQKSTVDADPKAIDEEATDVVIVSEASECATVNDAEFFGVDPDASRLSEKDGADVEEHLQGSNNAEIITVYATEMKADECGLISEVSVAMPGNIPQEMNDVEEVGEVEDVGEAIEFSSVQESGDLDVEAEISRVCEKDENAHLEESNMCNMQVENGDGHMLCDVSGLILPRNVSQQLSEEQTEIVIVDEAPEFTSGKDSEDLGEDPESSSMCERKEMDEGNLEFNNNNADNVVQLEVHTFEHDVCTMEVENEDGDMMGDVPCILPGNAVIVSNLSNGECEMTTYQIPDAEVPIETVQALLAMNDTAPGNR